MESFINIHLMKNPTNWVVIILMWMLGTMLLHYLSMHWTGAQVPGETKGS